MADPTGTTRTPWAASADGGELYHSDDDREVAIRCAVEDAASDMEYGRRDEARTVAVHVVKDVLWCTGPTADDPLGDCYCGTGHEDHEWIMMEWADGGTETREVAS